MYPPAGAAPPDFAAQQAQLIERQVQAEISRIREDYKLKLEAELKTLRDELHKELRQRIQSLVIAVAAGLLALFSVYVYQQAKTANSSLLGFQNAVLGLQKEVLASQNTIRGSVHDATREIDDLSRQLAAGTKQLNDTRSELASTSQEYRTRLAQLTLPPSRPTPPVGN